MIQIQLKGSRRVTKMLMNLPEKLTKEIEAGAGEFTKRIQKSAKLRAPRMTGELAKSIINQKIENGWALIVQSPYGLYQERGYRPHWVHALMPTKNSLGTLGNAYNIAGFMFVSKFHPFVEPALKANLPGISEIMLRRTKSAITQARR